MSRIKELLKLYEVFKEGHIPENEGHAGCVAYQDDDGNVGWMTAEAKDAEEKLGEAGIEALGFIREMVGVLRDLDLEMKLGILFKNKILADEIRDLMKRAGVGDD